MPTGNRMCSVGQSGLTPNNPKRWAKLSCRKFRYLNTHKMPTLSTILAVAHRRSAIERPPRIIKALPHVVNDVRRMRPNMRQSHQP